MSSRWFHIVDGKGYDWKFVKRDDPNGGHEFLFYLCGDEDTYVGTVTQMPRGMGWVSIPRYGPDNYKLVYGFISRHRCTDHLLQVSGERLEKVLK